jgi:hypothetical protein
VHVVFALVGGLIYLLGGLILKFMGAGADSRNPVAGYRTPRSMKSPESWVAANRYAAKAFFAAGAGILLFGMVLWWKPLPQYNELVILALILLSPVAIILATESHLKRRFDEDGTARPEPLGSAGDAGEAKKMPYSRLEWLLEAASLLLILLGAIVSMSSWRQLPDLVPRHYDYRGVVDAWGGKGSLAALPVVNALLYLALTLVRIFVPAHSGKEMPRRSLILGMELIAWLKATTAGIFTYLTWSTVQIALGRAEALSPLFLPLSAGFYLVILAVYVVLILRGKS